MESKNSSQKIPDVTMDLPKSPRSSGKHISDLVSDKDSIENDSDNEVVPDDLLTDKEDEKNKDESDDNSDPLGLTIRVLPDVPKEENKTTKIQRYLNKWKFGLSRYAAKSDIQKFLEENNYQLINQYCYTNKKKCVCLIKLVTPMGDPLFAYITDHTGVKCLDSDINLKIITSKTNIPQSFKNGLIKNLTVEFLGLVFCGDNVYNMVLKDGREQILVEHNFDDDVSNEYTFPIPLIDIREIKRHPYEVSKNISDYTIRLNDIIQDFNRENLVESEEKIKQLTTSFKKFKKLQDESFVNLDNSRSELKNILGKLLSAHKNKNINLERKKYGAIVHNIYQRSEMGSRLCRLVEIVNDLASNINQIKNNVDKLSQYLENEYSDLDDIFEPEFNISEEN